MNRFITVLSILFLCIGCAANRDAQHLAIKISGSVVNYEKQVDKKAKAEEAFYRGQLETLRSITGGYKELYQNQKKDTSIQKEENWSLFEGQIITNMERDSRLLANKIIRSKSPDTLSLLIEYVSSGVTEEQALYRKIQEQQEYLTKELLKGLDKIEIKKKDLKSIRKNLVALASESGIFDQITEYVEFGQKVRKELEKEEE